MLNFEFKKNFAISGLRHVDWNQTKATDPCASRIIWKKTRGRREEALVDSSSSNERAQESSATCSRGASRVIDENNHHGDQHHREITHTKPENPIPDELIFKDNIDRPIVNVPIDPKEASCGEKSNMVVDNHCDQEKINDHTIDQNESNPRGNNSEQSAENNTANSSYASNISHLEMSNMSSMALNYVNDTGVDSNNIARFPTIPNNDERVFPPNDYYNIQTLMPGK